MDFPYDLAPNPEVDADVKSLFCNSLQHPDMVEAVFRRIARAVLGEAHQDKVIMFWDGCHDAGKTFLKNLVKWSCLPFVKETDMNHFKKMNQPKFKYENQSKRLCVLSEGNADFTAAKGGVQGFIDSLKSLSGNDGDCKKARQLS